MFLHIRYKELCDLRKQGSACKLMGASPTVGHLTQVLWKTSTKIGCGVQLDSSGNRYLMSANYEKRGNFGWANDYVKNLPACAKRKYFCLFHY